MKKQLRITVNGKTYEVEAEILNGNLSSRTQASAAPVSTQVPVAPARPKAVSTGTPGDIPSPIAGTVVSVAKPEGSEVVAGDVVLVLEAMKMNTEVTSPCEGTVTKVHVSQGQNVEEGQALITIA